MHVVEALRRGAIERAVRHAADDRFDGDELRVHVTRHWYQRCYDTIVDEMVGARHPLAAITAGEDAEVARALATGEVRRLIGRDGIPLVTAHQTVMNDLDRRLAAGETGLVPPSIVEVRNHDGFKPLEQRVRAAWTSVDRTMRGEWLFLADALPLPDDSRWSRLSSEQQTRLVGHYLKTHRLELLGRDFDRPILQGDSADVARRMFNHRAPLVAEGAEPAAEARGAGFEPVESANRSIESSRGLTR
ncbi:hypothetical protein FHX74_000448 [Friedmanniella endophytica]|uniref:Uncharacterized protein n=1 Tax=Microlunatus kandeliicorticis TaxID=1759536 RepID=A0A7W3P4E7_9ACTN|nr:hypothetical protein [Microlunatus kandeliicorticis]MBA8792854.1 hypothetical protein [Microlunatus kandeliicorticis]